MKGGSRGLEAGESWSGPLAISAAVLVVPLLPSLPGAWLVLSSLVLAVFAHSRRWPRAMMFFLLALAWTLIAYRQGVEDRLHARDAGRIVTIVGTVASVPEELGERLRFRFRPDSAALPKKLLISWYRDWPDMHAGDRWRLVLRLKPPWAAVNFHGPDRERWLFSEGIGALGTVSAGERLKATGWAEAPIQTLRDRVKAAVTLVLEEPRWKAVVLALAIADRSGLERADRQVLRATGTAHLLAISGLHVGLAALGGGLLVRGLLFLAPTAGLGRLPHLLMLVGGLAAAACYALLADLGVSTLRAFLMVAAVSGAIALARPVHPVRAFMLALAGVLVADPLAPLGSGFWFSFSAVFALLFAFQPMADRMPRLLTLVSAQVVVFLFLLPVNAAWLGGFSLTSLVANLLAIPWVSLLVVPPVLAGVLVLPVYGPAAAALWMLGGFASGILFQVLDAIAALRPFLTGVNDPGIPALVLAAAGALLLLVPRAAGLRWPAVFLLLPLFLPARSGPERGELQIDALDVGQGTAVVLRTRKHALLYDTGPGDNAGSDYVDSTIAPVFSKPGSVGPERVVLSHGDLDHGGGLVSIRQRFPGIPVLGSVSEAALSVTPCIAGLKWRRDGYEFTTLHPSPGMPYLRNNSSCVLSVKNGHNAVLFSGDIDRGIESRLLLDGLTSHDILLVPHHGSASSSSPAFVERVAPRIALAPAGLGNRFGFPRETVRQRYLSRGAAFWATGECGGLRVMLHADGRLTAASARRETSRIWRWPAAENCP